MKIARTNLAGDTEPLVSAFGFKGAALSELWQSMVLLQDADGHEGLGLGVQSPLWSDAELFAVCGQTAANQFMLDLTRYALKLAQDVEWDTPPDLLDQILPGVLAEGRRSTGRVSLRLTFVLNALVAVDCAAWQLYAAACGLRTFDAMISAADRQVLTYRHSCLASIPLVTYGLAESAIRALLDAGHCVLKIKIGSDPAQDGDREKMLAWDVRRLATIHALARDCATPHTRSGRPLYYLDANGRYDGKERLLRLLEAAARMGALERILVVEEPFSEDDRTAVGDLPVPVAADESAHSVADTEARMDLGYRMLALKPVAKTLSLSLRMARAAARRGVACFCADLTVNPTLAEWNRNVAARLAPLPGLKVGVVEGNGSQYYQNWETLKTHHPLAGGRWLEVAGGLHRLDEAFYRESGGLLRSSPYYRSACRLADPNNGAKANVLTSPGPEP